MKSGHVFRSNHRVNQSADLFAAAAAAAAAGAAAMVLFSFGFGSAVWGSGFCSKKLILCLMSLALSRKADNRIVSVISPNASVCEIQLAALRVQLQVN